MPKPKLIRHHHRRLADEVNSHIAAAQEHAEAAVLHAVQAGQALLKAKVTLPYGKWLDWLQKNVPSLSIRSVQGYMRLAAFFERMPEPEAQRVAHLPLRKALAVISGRAQRQQAADDDEAAPDADDEADGDESKQDSEIEFDAEPDPSTWWDKARRDAGRRGWKQLKAERRIWAKARGAVMGQLFRYEKGDVATVPADVLLLGAAYKLLSTIRGQVLTLKQIIEGKAIDSYNLKSLRLDLETVQELIGQIEAWAAEHPDMLVDPEDLPDGTVLH